MIVYHVCNSKYLLREKYVIIVAHHLENSNFDFSLKYRNICSFDRGMFSLWICFNVTIANRSENVYIQLISVNFMKIRFRKII